MDKKEYIEREDAINEFNIRSSYYEAEWGNKRFTLNNVEEILRDVPAADVRPVVRGKWVEHTHILYDGKPGYSIECTACHEVFTEVDLREKPSKYNFCPNCGADMREEP